MTIRVLVTIECSGCGNQHDEKYPAMALLERPGISITAMSEAVGEAQRDAASVGWRVRTGPTDLCPTCLGEERRR